MLHLAYGDSNSQRRLGDLKDSATFSIACSDNLESRQSELVIYYVLVMSGDHD